MSDAEDICARPGPDVLDVIAEVAVHAVRSQGPAFRFCRAPDGSLYEVRVFADESFILTPVDEAGRPIGTPKPQGSDVPYLVGQSSGVDNPPLSLREQIRSEERKTAQEARVLQLAELEPPPEPQPAADPEPQVTEPEPRGKVARFFLGDKRQED